MDEKIKIATGNIRSLKKIEKILYLHDICEKNKIDILFIQETHLNEVIFQNEIKKFFKNYTIYMPILDTSYKGVGVIARNSCINIIRIEIIDPDRIMNIEIKINDTVINFINIYAPNLQSEQIDFINELYENLVFKDKLIILGDFNFNLSTSNNKVTLARQWQDFEKNFKLKEFDFNDQLNERSITRIDRMYYSDDLKNFFKFKYYEVIDSIYSDHKLAIGEIYLKITSMEKRKKNLGNWRLNDSILNDEIVVYKMIYLCDEIKMYFNETSP